MNKACTTAIVDYWHDYCQVVFVKTSEIFYTLYIIKRGQDPDEPVPIPITIPVHTNMTVHRLQNK